MIDRRLQVDYISITVMKSPRALQMIRKCVLFAFLIFPLVGYAQRDTSDKKVTFRVLSKLTSFAAKVHITGNHPQLGDWQYPFVQLEEHSDGVWEKTFSFSKGTRVQYAFNLGSSECVGLDSAGNVLGQSILEGGALHRYSLLEVVTDTIVTTRIPNWRQGEIHVSTDVFNRETTIQLWDVLWKYHPGDPAVAGEWAQPDFDDSSWELVGPELRPNELPKSGWDGVGWFRLHIVTDSTFSQGSLGITGNHSGSIQIVWDGKLESEILDFRLPMNLPVGGMGEHVMAVRCAIPSINLIHEEGSPAGFFIRLGNSASILGTLLEQRSEQMFFTALTLAFGLLHLILFLFSPSARGNLYYSILLFIFAAVTYVDIHSSYLARDVESALDYLRIHRALVPLSSIFFLRFVYSIFYTKCPRQFWLFTLLFIGVGILLAFEPQTQYHYYVILSTIAQLEVIRVIVAAILEKKDGAWIFATGIFIFGVFGSYDALLDLDLLAPINQITNAYYFGLFGLFIASSVYLARDFSRTTQKLVEQERRVKEEELARKLIEADNKRKTKELDEARQLQLSMLPQCLNDIPEFDICFHMETATEVGGDYYDYHVSDDGALTIAIGDATGHGMKAGTMVSVIKSLFISLEPQTDILSFFKKCTAAIKQMRLGNLYMALMLVKIKNGKMTASSAGMPPIHIFRSKTKSIEELVIKGMPLGGPASFSYIMKETTLAPGDAVLLMSDGFPELFDDKNEMLDYPRVKEIFRESVERSADGIVRHLTESALKWRKGRALDDDMTFVVVKMNGLSQRRRP
jgi:serine phosphatase RsbU (regulator of sigma subunit)